MIDFEPDDDNQHCRDILLKATILLPLLSLAFPFCINILFVTNTDSLAEVGNAEDEFTIEKKVIQELSHYEDSEVSDHNLQNDPRSRRRRRRRRRGRRQPFNLRKFRKVVKSIVKFLKKNGEKIVKGIRAIRRGIWRCCIVTRKCAGKGFCKFGKP